MRIDAALATHTSVALLEGVGVPTPAARIQAALLIDAELRGHPSHGLWRLPRVLERMLPYFVTKFGNAASRSHSFGWEAEKAVEHARQRIAELAGASPREIVFTSGATESNNLALKGVLGAAPAGRHLIVSAAEHRSVPDPAKRLQRRGAELTILPVDRDARVDPQALAAAIRPNTVLVSVMFANNEVGTINPVAEIAALCRQRGVLFHCDAVQAVGRVPVDLGHLSESRHRRLAAQPGQHVFDMRSLH